jgi:hypothetical protein
VAVATSVEDETSEIEEIVEDQIGAESPQKDTESPQKDTKAYADDERAEV